MDIVTYPSDALLAYATEVRDGETTINGMEVGALASSMLELMYKSNGVGLAAPQVGISRRLWVARLDGKDVIAINPEVSQVPSAASVEEYEGCLSIPGVSVRVKRSSAVMLSCRHSATGSRYSWQYDGLAARIIQHETDHLNARLITYGLTFLPPFLRRFPGSGANFVTWFVANRTKIAKELLVDEVCVDLSKPAIIYRVGDRTIREDI